MLDDGHSTIASYGVIDKSILHLVDLNINDRGGFSCMGAKFVDINNKDGLKRADWSKTDPTWHISQPGLCLEGQCTNHQCKAYGQTVIMPFGYTMFDICIDSNETTAKCHLCNKYVEPTTCGTSPTKCSSHWQQADNAYHYFDEYISGIVLWKQLIVGTVKNKPSD